MSRRKVIILKATALTLSLLLLLEVVFPTIALALTSGPTAPEVYGHQPVDATDNVSLVTGDFNYTIPVTSIPEYPMAIGYNSQAGMDQDAGIFGYSVNGFSGAIARSLQGLPDDLNGAPKRYEYDNQKRWRASMLASYGYNYGDVISLSGGMMAGYDNFTGIFRGLSGSVGLSLKNWDIPFSFGVQGSVGSEEKADVTFFGKYDGKQGEKSNDLAFQASIYVSTRYGVSAYAGFQNKAMGFGIGGPLKDLGAYYNSNLLMARANFNDMSGKLGVTDFSAQTHTNTSSFAPLSSLLGTTKSFGSTISIPIYEYTATHSYMSSNYGNLDETKDAFGFMYLKNYNRTKKEHIGDFTVEGEFSFDKDFRNSPAYLQRDFFMVNAQGFSGSMQLHQAEPGVVSRYYNRYQSFKVSNAGSDKEIKEVEPWKGVSRANVNRQLDILKLIKKADDEGEKDFDNTIFVEDELRSLTTDEYSFGNEKPKFKMRGDMAGEFNLASSGSRDYDPNTYDLVHVQGTGGRAKYSFMSEEKDMPLYFPQIPQAVNNKYTNAGALKSSTQITYYTVEDILSAFPAQAKNANPQTDKKFAECYYTHHKIVNAGNKKTPLTIGANNSNLSDFNLLSHLQKMREGKPAVDKVIADVRIKTSEGLHYIYNLPVFNHLSKSLQLQGKGLASPIQVGNDYASFHNAAGNKYRQKVMETEQYPYPYAWMLTAIVGPDYIDFDEVAGPSEGDLGYWVKFKYVKSDSSYKWRFPFTGLSHNIVANQKVDDDVYSASTGTKEIYYISEIESSSHLSKYIYSKRFDGIDAKDTDLYNGPAFNSLTQRDELPTDYDPTGDNSQYAVTRIELYKKHFEADHSSKRTDVKGKLIRATEFKYDYSICPNTPNNITNYTGNAVLIKDVPYHKDYSPSNTGPIGTGKLTLRKVQHFSYEGSTSVALPAYDLTYSFDNSNNEYNPSYDRNQIDQWGNYSRLSRKILPNDGSTGNPQVIKDINGSFNANLSYYHHYPELDKVQANENAKVFKLSKVDLPTGGSLMVDYEARGYGKVQDLTPYVMRPVRRNLQYFENTRTLKVSVDVTDLHREDKTLKDVFESEAYQEVFGEFSFYESNSADYPSREDELFVVKEQAVVDSFGTTIEEFEGRAYQDIFLSHKRKPGQKIPFVTAFREYLYGESLKMMAIKEDLDNRSCNLDGLLAKYEHLDKEDEWSAMKKLAANVRNFFRKDDTFKDRFHDCFGQSDDIVFPHQSFIGTPIFKEKYTGSRVKSLSFSDGFNYGTNASGNGKVKRENVYTTNYFYDENGNGTGVSAGVVTIEPGGGESCVVDLRNTRGAGFFPAPMIIQSKTTVETAYAVPESSSENQKISRKKGRTEYQFYTPMDKDLDFGSNMKYGEKVPEQGSANGKFFIMGILTWLMVKIRLWPTKKKIKVPLFPPIIIPVNVKWKRSDHYHLRSYAYSDVSDIYGRPKAIINYSGENKSSFDAADKSRWVTKTEYNYYDKSKKVRVYDGSGGSLSNDPFGAQNDSIRPGRVDQTWSEAYYTKESKIKAIPAICFVNAKTERNFSFTNMKYTYVPPVLKEIISTSSIDNTKSVVQQTAFDYYTGQPVETKTSDSYGNTKIARIIPAYWKYPKMGPASLDAANLNMLTASTASYLYLNTTDNDHLLGVGISEWSQDQVKFVNTQRLSGKINNTSDFNYQYEVLNKDAVEKLYNTNGKTRPEDNSYPASKVVNTYLPDAKWISKPVRNYAFETPLKADGTFSTFAPFVWGTVPSAGSGWKLGSENTLFDAYGRVVETKDILEKYASAHFGYNFAYSTAVVGNSTLAGSAYTGAENTYLNAFGGKTLDDSRITLGDALIMQTCNRGFTTKTFNYNNYISGTKAAVLNICVPAVPVYNIPFARFKATFTNSSGNSITRTIYIRYNENKDFSMLSDKGEAFKGFYVLPQPAAGSCSNTVKIAIEPSVFANLDASYTNSGYLVTAAQEFLQNCTIENKTYSLPANDCGSEAHTGQYAFLLQGTNSKGTLFEVDFASMPAAEKRKYKAMVWVHNSSPKQTALVAEGVSGSTGTVIKSATLSTPYLVAGNWSLLRLEADPDPGAYSKLRFYIQNQSAAGNSIYDDLRVLPYQATMENTVYDHFTGRVTAKLDNENFATYYLYDTRGRLIEVKTEVEKLGRQTVKKYVYHEQKAN